MSVGRGTARNAAARSAISLCYPPVDDGGYSLIIDGTAAVDGEATVRLAPTGAVLHRPAPEDSRDRRRGAATIASRSVLGGLRTDRLAASVRRSGGPIDEVESDRVQGASLTVATASRRVPPSQTATFGSASVLRIHCESERTVLTVSVSPRRVESTGTGRGRPERRPVVSSTTAPAPIGSGLPMPASDHGTNDPVERGEAPLGD